MHLREGDEGDVGAGVGDEGVWVMRDHVDEEGGEVWVMREGGMGDEGGEVWVMREGGMGDEGGVGDEGGRYG